ncbi:MAG TPA: hypothetical protein VIJ25_00170 [Methylococcales bacterium]
MSSSLADLAAIEHGNLSSVLLTACAGGGGGGPRVPAHEMIV